MSEGRQLKVYVAASREIAGEADALAARLREAGVLVVSKWHDGQTHLVDPSDPNVRQKILKVNLSHLEQADVVVALMHAGQPKATYGEIGYALAWGHAVLWFGPPADQLDPLACIFDAHENVWRYDSLVEVIDRCVGFQEATKLPGVAETMFAEFSQFGRQLRRVVEIRMKDIERGMGVAFAHDANRVRDMLGEAAKAIAEFRVGADREWMNVVFDVLSLATMVGEAAAAKQREISRTKAVKEEMN